MVLALTSRVAGDPLTPMWRGSVQGSPLLTIDLGPLGAKDAPALAGGLSSSPSEFAREVASNERRQPAVPRAADACRRRAGGWPPGILSQPGAAREWTGCRNATARRCARIGRRPALPLALVRELAQLPDFSCDVLMAHFLVLVGRRRVSVRARADQGRRLCVADAGPPCGAASRRREVVRRARSGARRGHLDRAEAPERRARTRRRAGAGGRAAARRALALAER